MFLLKSFKEYLSSLDEFNNDSQSFKAFEIEDIFKTNTIKVQQNPSFEFILRMFRSNEKLRFIVTNNDIFIWSAFDGTHEDVLKSSVLGLQKEFNSDYPSENFGSFQKDGDKLRVYMYRTNNYVNFLNCRYVKRLIKQSGTNILIYVKENMLDKEGHWVPAQTN